MESNMEEKYGKPHQEIFDELRHLSVGDKRERAKRPFTKVMDQQAIRDQQGSLFDTDMDTDFDCMCNSI